MGIFVELNNFDISERLIFIKRAISYGAPNYKEIIDELKNHHEMTAEKIAFVLPISGASTVNEWTRHGIPNYDNGAALIEIWKILTGKEDKDIPRINYWSI